MSECAFEQRRCHRRSIRKRQRVFRNIKPIMTPDREKRKHTIREYRGQRLVEASTLFQTGELSDELSDRDFTLRLNRLLALQPNQKVKRPPSNLAKAIRKDGTLREQAELIVLGRWLLCDGRPGMTKSPGPQPDYRELLQCVSAALDVLNTQAHRKKIGKATGGRKSRKNSITKTDLAHSWENLLGEKVNPSFFDSRLKSLKHILPSYLMHLKSGSTEYDSKKIQKSSQVKKVLDAISGQLEKTPGVSKTILQKSTMQKAAHIAPFDINLRYSSTNAEADYRNTANMPTQKRSCLRYVPSTAASTSASGKLRTDRRSNIVLTPEVDIRHDYKVNALIDRIVILVSTEKYTEWQKLKDTIAKDCGIETLVQDLTLDIQGSSWGAPLPKLDLAKRTGFHFAIPVQDPTPDMLTCILSAIRNGPGIDNQVQLHLIEISVDFHSKNYASVEESIEKRERMVALLHRHHWTAHSHFCSEELDVPRHSDARQFFADDQHPRYFFAHGTSGSFNSDQRIDLADIRKRVLTKSLGRDLFLNSTVAKGGKHSNYHVTIQHKIANRRNNKNSTKEVLPDNSRRARVEVTISDSKILKKRKLATVDDLATVSFRTLTKPFLGFKLGAVDPGQYPLEDAKDQMHTRGVYGIELRNRALQLEEREQMRGSGQRLSNYNDREGFGLQDWPEMNKVIGQALDQLQRRWRHFSSA